MSEAIKALGRDFPDLDDQLTEQYMADPRLARLIDDYARLREEIDRIDQTANPELREEAEGLKRRRVRLKDSIRQRLTERARAA